MDNPSDQPPALGPTPTIADVLRDMKPMGDPSQFAIDDLTPEKEDEFVRILEDT